MTNASSAKRIASWFKRAPETLREADAFRIVFRDPAGREDSIVQEYPAGRVLLAIKGEENGRMALAEEVHQLLQDDCDGRERRTTYALQLWHSGQLVAVHRLELLPGDRKPDDDALMKPPAEDATPVGLLAMQMRHMEVRERAMLGSIGSMQRMMIELMDRLSDSNARMEKDQMDTWSLMRALVVNNEDRDLRRIQIEQANGRWERIFKNVEEVVIPLLVANHEDKKEAEKAKAAAPAAAAAAAAPDSKPSAANGNGHAQSDTSRAAGWTWSDVAAAAWREATAATSEGGGE